MKLWEFFAETPNADKLDKPTPTIADLAQKYGVSTVEVHRELQKGIKIEHEHTSDPIVAKEIALDHLGERLDYYTQLAKIETNEAVKKKTDEKTLKSAVADLENKLLATNTRKHTYKEIDSMMQKISKEKTITAKELHDAFEKKNGVSPDEWIEYQEVG
jgi:hypothetical protein